MAIGMPRPALVRFNGTPLSDHNREPLDISVERIETTTRVASGRLRKFFVADKRSFSLSWNMLPETAARTVDGQWGAKELTNFFDTTPDEFTLSVIQSDNTITNYTVIFTDFSATPVKRWETYYYDVSLSLEEV